MLVELSMNGASGVTSTSDGTCHATAIDEAEGSIMAEDDRAEFMAELAEALGWREQWDVHPIEPSALLAEVRRLLREVGGEETNRDFNAFHFRTAKHVGLVPYMRVIDETATEEEGPFPLYESPDKPPRDHSMIRFDLKAEAVPTSSQLQGGPVVERIHEYPEEMLSIRLNEVQVREIHQQLDELIRRWEG